MAARPRTINDRDRRQGMRAFIREHRADIDQVIHAVRDAPPRS